MTNNCAVCGANLDMVGRVHRCVPRPMDASTGTPPAVSGGSSYKHRDPEKWRAYMREYMRKRRAKHG